MRPTRIAVTIALTLCVAISGTLHAQDAKAIVVKALDRANKLGVTGREFQTKANPKGQGTFVYDPRTRFAGVERNLIWLVVKGQAFALNGPTKTLTPSLKWPREADPALWKTTGLDAYMATEAIKIVFGS